jgi:hypothetical protein
MTSSVSNSLLRKIDELQKKLLDLETAIRRKENPVAHEKILPRKPPEEPTPYTLFRDRVRADIAHNIISPTYSYSPETDEFAMVIRSMCPSCYEFARTILPMPGLLHIDERFQCDEILSQIYNFSTAPDHIFWLFER